MKTVENYESIRRDFFIEGLSIRAIHRQLNYHRDTIHKAIVNQTPQPYQLSEPRPTPVLGPHKERINEMWKSGNRSTLAHYSRLLR